MDTCSLIAYTNRMRVRKLPWLISQVIANERKYMRRYDVSPITAAKLWRQGHFSYAAVLYDLDRLELYLSHKDQHETIAINGAMGEAMRNKYVFKQFLAGEFGDHLPQTLGLVRRGEYHATNGPATLLDVINQTGGVVCKPLASGRGEGVHVIEAGERYHVDGKPIPREKLIQSTTRLDDFLVEEQVEQHEFQAAIFPNAVNTMRILSMVHPDTHEPFIGAAVHRFAVPNSAPTDNWSQGGIVADIDLETGELAPAITASGNAKRHLDRHPTTERKIAGKQVPNWTAVQELVLSAAEEFGVIWPYIGWDITIAADGTPTIIEANRASDVDLLQLNEPLLADERCRRFYEHHEII